MKLYRSKIPEIAENVVRFLTEEDMIEVEHEKREEAQKDFAAIMEDFSRRDFALREEIKEVMHHRNLPYDQYGRTRSQLAKEWGHPLGGDVERYLARQFVENLMISPFIDEVYEEDNTIYKRVLEILRSFDVDEEAIREEARAMLKNLQEGTVEWEVQMQKAVVTVKKRKGLL